MKIRDRIKSLRRVKASELAPNPRNWRTHPESQRAAMQGVLEEIGFAGAALSWTAPDGLHLIDGHLRSELTGDQEIPVLETDLTEEEATKLSVYFDSLGAAAEVDEQKLGELLAEIETENEGVQALLDSLAAENGVDLYEDGAETPDVEPQVDRAAELQEQWGTESGQLWAIPGKAGEHRLLCGDSTSEADVVRLFVGNVSHLMATDPPYGVDFAGGKFNPRAKQWEGIANDKRQGDDLTAWLASVLHAWMPVMSSDACFYLWTAPMQEGFAAAAAAAAAAAGIHIQGQIIWVKNQFALGQADYQWMHEPCWYGYRKGNKHRWLSDRCQTTVWEVDKVANAKYEHPHQKPIELYARPMRHHIESGEIVADPFLGSGTTMLAAEQLGRICYGMEISPAYCAVILQRMTDAGLEPYRKD